MLFVDDDVHFTFVWKILEKKLETCTSAYKTLQPKFDALGQGYQIK